MTSESQAMPAAPSAPDHEHPNQFALLKQRRFAPFFWTQFSGAANDNLFKFAFTVMVTYQLSVGWMPPALAGLVIGGDLRLVGNSFDNVGNTARLNGYAIGTVRASMPLGERFELFGRVENVGDVKYQTVAGYNTPGRSAYVGARAKF